MDSHIVAEPWTFRWYGIVAAFSVLVAFGPAVRAASMTEQSREVANQYIDALIEKESLQARIDFMQQEAERLKAGKGTKLSEVGALEERTKGTIDQLLIANLAPVSESIDDAAVQQDEVRKNLVDSWRKDRAILNEARINMASIQAKKRAAGRVASLVTLYDGLFFLSALIAVAILTLFVWHDRRHEFRRALRGLHARGSRALRLLMVLTVALFAVTVMVLAFGGYFYEFVVGSPESQTLTAIENEVASIEGERKQLQETHDVLERQVEAATEAWAADAYLGDKWRDLRKELLPVVVGRHVESHVVNEYRDDLAKLTELTNSQPKLLQDIRDYGWYKRMIQAGIGSSLLGMIGLGLVSFTMGVRQRKKKSADTCPLCLGTDTLEPVSDSAGNDDDFAKLRCSNLNQHTQIECGFEFLSVYRELTKLCFPTVGHPQSGKTHWLAMVYRQLNQADFESSVQFQKVKSNESEQFDRLVEDIINTRMRPGATQTYDIPRPLLFDFIDQDRWGGSNALLNIFDYSGEVTRQMTLDDEQRRRMLQADGYFFFLDPTAPAEEQAKELVDFAEDVRIVRKLKSGQSMRAPVALCVSKIDLLRIQDYADPGGGGPVGRFYDELERLDTGRKISKSAIRERSKLMEELRHTIWPGWQIEKQIENLFGGRYMYFPLTPVGLSDLDEAELTDLSSRTIAPRWILEPFMWLLDMNGYRVFDGD